MYRCMPERRGDVDGMQKPQLYTISIYIWTYIWNENESISLSEFATFVCLTVDCLSVWLSASVSSSACVFLFASHSQTNATHRQNAYTKVYAVHWIFNHLSITLPICTVRWPNRIIVAILFSDVSSFASVSCYWLFRCALACSLICCVTVSHAMAKE